MRNESLSGAFKFFLYINNKEKIFEQFFYIKKCLISALINEILALWRELIVKLKIFFIFENFKFQIFFKKPFKIAFFRLGCRWFLSIRPFVSKKYANDLSVKAILELSKKEFFKDLEFLIIGDGELFEETLKPLREFKNITIQQRFLQQEEIAKLHKEYGIFLNPTRMDSQGVSRDEASSSGLVPITNKVAAIPEFVDERGG